MRLFIAIDPSMEQREKLQILQQRLAHSLGGVRWVRPEGLHLTLKFLGEQEAEKVPLIITAMQIVSRSVSPFYLQFGSTGVFPSPKRARIIWTGIHRGASETEELADSLEKELAKRGFPLERRPFKAHLTLGRVRLSLPGEKVGQLLSAEKNFKTEKALVTSMSLYESRLTPRGAQYTTLEEILFLEK